MVGLAIGKISYVHPETKQTERKKFFDGLIFDRVIPGVMIQGGDLLGTGVGHPEGPGFPYKSEIVPALKFDAPGRLAMANSGPDTNDTHFFITEAAYPAFNGKYTIWGQCENVDVVKAIAQVPRDAGDTPVTSVHIQRVVDRSRRPRAGRCSGSRAAARCSLQIIQLTRLVELSRDGFTLTRRVAMGYSRQSRGDP